MLTFQKYNAIRILIESGETVENIAASMNCKKETVYLVKRCETYEKYKQESTSLKFLNKAKNKQNDAKHEPKTQAVMNVSQIKIEATHYMMEELRKNNEILTLISNKLAAIMEELGCMK